MAQKNGLLIRNTSGDEDNILKVQEAVQKTMDSIRELGDEYLAKLPPDEFEVMVNTRILDAVKALNIEGLTIVPANDAGLEMLTDTSDHDRKRIREAVEEAKATMGDMPGLEERAEAVQTIVFALAKFAMATVQYRSGPAEMFHDFGQVIVNAVTETACGAKNMAKPDDKMAPAAAKMLNRIAFISALKMLLNCDAEQAERSCIDQTAIREDIAAVLDGKSDDRIKGMIDTLNDFSEVARAKSGDKGGATLH
jgi:hypothetical protein